LDSGRSSAEIAVDSDEAGRGLPMSETKPTSESPPAGCRPKTSSPYGRQLGFIDLNSSVRKQDESRLSRQAHQVLEFFRTAYRKGQPVSTIDLVKISSQYNARVHEVRHFLIPLGWCIDCTKRTKSGVNYYRVVSLTKSEFYRSHKTKLDLECGL
jgi:hypothetical protein